MAAPLDVCLFYLGLGYFGQLNARRTSHGDTNLQSALVFNFKVPYVSIYLLQLAKELPGFNVALKQFVAEYNINVRV